MESFTKGLDLGTHEVPVVQTFESFYQAQYRPVFAVAFVLTGDRSEAEDLTQEAFTSLFKAWSSIANPAAWVRAAVSNNAMSRWRRIYAGRRAMARMSGSEPITEIADDTTEFWAEVRQLPRRQAQALVLHYLDDLTTQQIADVLGCGASTVRIHMSRGRKALAERLEVAE